MAQFRRMRELIQEAQGLQEWSVKKALVKDAGPAYRDCLQVLRKVLKKEDDGELAPTATLGLGVFEASDNQDSDEESRGD